MNTTKDETPYLQRLNNQVGFTLIEIMVVVVILSILAAFVVPKIMDRPEQARILKAKQDIRTLENALRMYKLDNLFYPSTDQGLDALIHEPTTEPVPKKWAKDGYIDRLSDDPWGKPYIYLQPGIHGSFDIYSVGPDGQPETEDDLGNWNLD